MFNLACSGFLRCRGLANLVARGVAHASRFFTHRRHLLRVCGFLERLLARDFVGNAFALTQHALSVALNLRGNARFFGLALESHAILFLRDLRQTLVFDDALGGGDLRLLLIFDLLARRIFDREIPRMTRQVCRANLGELLSRRRTRFVLERGQRVVNLHHLVSAMMLADPRDDIRGRTRRLNRTVLQQHFNRRVIDNGRRMLEGRQQCSTRDERWNLGESFEIPALIFARRVAQVIKRSAMLATKDVVECGAQAQRTFFDERILRSDGLSEFALQHHAQFIDIDDDPAQSRERFVREFRRAFPQ